MLRDLAAKLTFPIVFGKFNQTGRISVALHVGRRKVG